MFDLLHFTLNDYFWHAKSVFRKTTKQNKTTTKRGGGGEAAAFHNSLKIIHGELYDEHPNLTTLQEARSLVSTQRVFCFVIRLVSKCLHNGMEGNVLCTWRLGGGGEGAGILGERQYRLFMFKTVRGHFLNSFAILIWLIVF